MYEGMTANEILASTGWPDNVLTSRNIRRIREEFELLYADLSTVTPGMFKRAYVEKPKNYTREGDY